MVICYDSMTAVGSSGPLLTCVIVEVITFGKEIREGCKRYDRAALARGVTHQLIYMERADPIRPRHNQESLLFLVIICSSSP